MTIKLLAVGKTDSRALLELINTYEGRLRHYIKFEQEIIPDLKKSKHLTQDRQRVQEGELILKRIEATDVMVVLDENGKQYASVAFSDYLQKRMNSGIKRLVFVIGGPYGFSESVYQKAQGTISFSKMTFSHQMIRLFVVEQIYRAMTILRNEPYHHQ